MAAGKPSCRCRRRGAGTGLEPARATECARGSTLSADRSSAALFDTSHVRYCSSVGAAAAPDAATLRTRLQDDGSLRRRRRGPLRGWIVAIMAGRVRSIRRRGSPAMSPASQPMAGTIRSRRTPWRPATCAARTSSWRASAAPRAHDARVVIIERLTGAGDHRRGGGARSGPPSGNPWTRAMLERGARAAERQPGSTCALPSSGLAAFCSCWVSPTNCTSIHAVRADHRGQGRAGLDGLCAGRRRRGRRSARPLEVRRSNVAAQRLYASLGFATVAVRRRITPTRRRTR